MTRTCRFEQMEPRRLLSADFLPLQVGAVYFEDKSGDDEIGDTIHITWSGGAPGTQLTELVIDTVKFGDQLAPGDAFFDTEAGGLGAFNAVGLSIEDPDGAGVTGAQVDDGGATLTLTFANFDPDKTLVLTIDVDEQGSNPNYEVDGYGGPNAFAEGKEFEGSWLSATFTAPHYYAATGKDVFRDDFQRMEGLPPDSYKPPGNEARPIQTAAAIFSVEQEPLPITISGTVFEDMDVDNTQDPGDPGLPDVTLTLHRLAGGSYGNALQTVTTNAQGDYLFQNVLPGTYRIVESQPAGLLSVGATAGTVGGTTRGVVTSVDVISNVALLGGEDSIDNDFAEARPASLGGWVYHDADNDGIKDTGETGIGGVLVQVQYIPPAGGLMPPSRTTQTKPDGSWAVGGLMPGEYRVTEVQPNAYIDGLDAAGTPDGTAHNPGDLIDGIHLRSGEAGQRYNFGELLAARLSGHVYHDADNDGKMDPGESGIGGVTVRVECVRPDVLPAVTPAPTIVTTDASGAWSAGGLVPGLYKVVEIHPAGYIDGLDAAGTLLGTAHNPGDLIDGVLLRSGDAGRNYDFGELLAARLSGHVYHDADNDGKMDPGESGIGGVQVRVECVRPDVLPAVAPAPTVVTTDASGAWSAGGMVPGLYKVVEIHPAGYIDGLDAAGTLLGTAHNPGDLIDGVLLRSGDAGRNYDFGELLPVSISGRVYVDMNVDGVFDSQDVLLPGVTIHLLNGKNKVIDTTLTDATGSYLFADRAPGVYGVMEVQPEDYNDGDDFVGSASGTLLPPDSIVGVGLASSVAAVGYDFSELPLSGISGYVYVDDNDNGLFEQGEAVIAGVEITLWDGNDVAVATTTTDAAGFYRFEGLMPGTYSVAETQPAPYFDGKDTAGSAGGVAHNPGDLIGNVPLQPAMDAENYNFGELRPASISGRVHAELNGDCTPGPGEPLLEGVTIHLLDHSGRRIRQTTTDANGEYIFRGLPPGTYGVEEIQPDGYLDGCDHVGTVAGKVTGRLDGNDRIVAAELGSGAAGVNYNFCEMVPATISGYVFQDGPTIVLGPGEEAPDPATLRDGQFTSDDTPIAGVVLHLGDGSGAPILDADGRSITAVTNPAGYYSFSMLEPGLYTILEDHPQQYVDSLDTPGSNGGLAVNPSDDLNPFLLSQLAVDPKDDAIIRIPMNMGDQAVSYNFSEVLMEQTPPIIPPPPPPPPPIEPPPPMPMLGEPPPRMIQFPPAVALPSVGFFGGSGGADRYTWHLSVINAGRPRRDRPGDDLMYDPYNPYFDPITWGGANLGQSQWIIANNAGVPIQKLRFGLPKAVPVAGDFNGDGVDEVGVFIGGNWFIDLNGNGIWDEDDFWARLGGGEDLPVVGDWDGDGKADIGIFGRAWPGDMRAVEAEPGLPDAGNPPSGRHKNLPPEPHQATTGWRHMKRTAHSRIRSDVIDHVFRFGSKGDRPVAGDWNGDGVASIGIFRDGVWFLDLDGNGRWSTTDAMVELGREGDVPVVGDFNNDGIDELGVYRGGTWYLDSNGNRRLDAHDKVFELGGPHDQPVVGDFNGDGTDQIAVYEDDAPPEGQGEE